MSIDGREVLADEEQRKAERAALRKVRGTLDSIEKEEKQVRSLKRVVFLISGALFVFALVVLAGLYLKGRQLQENSANLGLSFMPQKSASSPKPSPK
jgi:hypothetical protein